MLYLIYLTLFYLILSDSDSAQLDSYGILVSVNDSTKIINMNQCFLDCRSTQIYVILQATQ